MRVFFVTCCFFLLPAVLFAGVQKRALTTAIRLGEIEMRAVSTGALYFRKALQLELRNTTGDVLQVSVDPALIFRPSDTSCQELVLPGGEMLAVLPGKTVRVALQSFCGTSYARAPGDSLRYTFRSQGDSAMIRVAQYLVQHRLFDELGQSAIWALTNHHNLDGVYDPARPQASAALLAFLEKTTGWKAPDYFRLYKPVTDAGGPVFQKRSLLIVTQFDLRIDQLKMLSMGVYNAAGKEVQVAFKAQAMKPGRYKLMVRFEAGGATPGPYFLRVMDGVAVLREQRVVVE